MDSSAVPKVSVIIPLYNKAPYIKRALDSVFAQTVQDFEVIVVNDGSKDGGEKIVEEYGDSRIHLINQENQGVSAARNHGVDAARAELVAFLDADDEWLPEFLETILRLREKWPDAGMYGTGYEVVTATGGVSPRSFGEESGERLLTKFFSDKVVAAKSGFGMILMTSGMAVKKAAFNFVGGFNILSTYAEDRTLRGLIALYYHVAYNPKIAARYYTETICNSYEKDDFHIDGFSEKLSPKLSETISIISDKRGFIEYYIRGKLGRVPENIIHGWRDEARNQLRLNKTEKKLLNENRLRRYIIKSHVLWVISQLTILNGKSLRYILISIDLIFNLPYSKDIFTNYIKRRLTR